MQFGTKNVKTSYSLFGHIVSLPIHRRSKYTEKSPAVRPKDTFPYAIND
jgi:hypothetical protein